MDNLSEYLDYLLNKKNKEFDSFEPFQRVTLKNFNFFPSRFEVWEKGKMTISGNYNGIIEAVISKVNAKNISFHFSDSNMSQHILQNFQFNTCFTQKDRIQLAEIPPVQSSDCNGLNSLRDIAGETCGMKIFGETEPYCAGIFLQDSMVKKLTFSFNVPVRLIEFYE